MDNNFIKWYKDKCTWALKIDNLDTYLYLDDDIYGNKIYKVFDISELIEDVHYDFIRSDKDNISPGDLVIVLYSFEELNDKIKSITNRYRLVINNSNVLTYVGINGKCIEYKDQALPYHMYKIVKDNFNKG